MLAPIKGAKLDSITSVLYYSLKQPHYFLGLKHTDHFDYQGTLTTSKAERC